MCLPRCICIYIYTRLYMNIMYVYTYIVMLCIMYIISIVDSGFMISNRFVFESTLTVLWFRPTVDALPMASL